MYFKNCYDVIYELFVKVCFMIVIVSCYLVE